MAVHARLRDRLPAERLDLLVVPPRSRKLDGAVEGANGSWRYKRHAIYDLPDSLITLNPLIEGF